MIKKIQESQVYQEILNDSFGGVMYNIANQDKYDTKELLELWNYWSDYDRSCADWIVKGAMDFIQGK